MSNPKTFTYDTKTPEWYQSDVVLELGDRYRLDAEITIDLRYSGEGGEQRRSLNGAWVDHSHDPQAANQEYLSPGLWQDGIIARIGEGDSVPGAPFNVGASQEFTAEAAGYLQIAVNEKDATDHANNEGQVRFTVTVLGKAQMGKLVVAPEQSQAVRVPFKEQANSDGLEVAMTSLDILYDSSRSMSQPISFAATDATMRRDVAIEAFKGLVNSNLLDDRQVGLRVFPDDGVEPRYRPHLFENSYGGELVRFVEHDLEPNGTTPIAQALEHAIGDFEGIDGVKVVMLLTDGEADGGIGAVNQAAAHLSDATGAQLVINVVGFSLDAALAAQYSDLTKAHNGTFVSIDSQDEAQANFQAAAGLSFDIYDGDGAVVEVEVGNSTSSRFNVGGDPVSLPAGSYTLQMLPSGAEHPFEVTAGKTTVLATRAS